MSGWCCRGYALRKFQLNAHRFVCTQARAALPSADELFATTDSSRPDFLVTAAEVCEQLGGF